MVRKAGATDKKSKGSQHNETHMAGITQTADYIQKIGDPRGLALDQDIAAYAHKPASEVIHSPFGGFADVAGSTNNE